MATNFNQDPHLTRSRRTGILFLVGLLVLMLAVWHFLPYLLAPPVDAEAPALQAAWEQFARTGNPGWQSFDTTTRATMMLDRECHMVKDPGRAERLAQGALPSPP